MGGLFKTSRYTVSIIHFSYEIGIACMYVRPIDGFLKGISLISANFFWDRCWVLRLDRWYSRRIIAISARNNLCDMVPNPTQLRISSFTLNMPLSKLKWRHESQNFPRGKSISVGNVSKVEPVSTKGDMKSDSKHARELKSTMKNTDWK